jgi:hypothetical protein
MRRLLIRSALALVVLIAGLILRALGVSAGAIIALVGLLALFLVNLIAPGQDPSRAIAKGRGSGADRAPYAR